jgi:hypothetical protein
MDRGADAHLVFQPQKSPHGLHTVRTFSNYLHYFRSQALDICTFYLEGKWAIIPNLPCPTVTQIGEHVYVTLTVCIVDLLDHGIPN